MSADQRQDHWNTVYNSKHETEVSWFQPYPATSLAFLDALNLPKTAAIIDIGGGDSHLVDVLLDRGFENLWVLDISAASLERAKQRLGDRAARVHWVVSDVTEFEPPIPFDCWHDRAAFHFLTDEADAKRYVGVAERALRPGADLILGTFSETGPEKCSGLAVRRYDEASLQATLHPGFRRIHCVRTDHVTPSGAVQNFLFCHFRRK
jgi:SAM-dependent methyltransferase